MKCRLLQMRACQRDGVRHPEGDTEVLNKIEPIRNRALRRLLRKGEVWRNADLVHQECAGGMLVAVDPIGQRGHGARGWRRRRLLHGGRESGAQERGQCLHIHRSR